MEDLSEFVVPAGSVIHVKGVPFYVTGNVQVLGTPGNAREAEIDWESIRARHAATMGSATAPASAIGSTSNKH